MEKSSPDQNREALLGGLEERLGYSFQNKVCLETALTHSSYVNENPQLAVFDNERLEFLGDAVLELSISDFLFRNYADLAEGELSRIRASLVNEKQLAGLARQLELGRCLLLGRGEEISGGRAKDSLLANALEAVIAAVYLDAGFARARSVIRKLIRPLNEKNLLPGGYIDYKTALQEFCQKKFQSVPQYTLLDSGGPEHARIFVVEVKVVGKISHTGAGKSKREAEKQAAQKAWRELQDESE